MERPRVGTKNLKKLLMIGGHEIKLDSSFLSSEMTSLPDGDSALDLRYRSRPQPDSEEFMVDEVERVYNLMEERGLVDNLNVYGNNVLPSSEGENYTPHLAIVGDFKGVEYKS